MEYIFMILGLNIVVLVLLYFILHIVFIKNRYKIKNTTNNKQEVNGKFNKTLGVREIN